jgi:DNA invertase Pin-like site-specific DNA recombinase
MPPLDLQPDDYGICIARVSDAIQTTLPQQHRQMGVLAETLGVTIPGDGCYADIQSRSKGLETRKDLQAALTRARDEQCRVVIFFDDSRLIGDPAQALELFRTLSAAQVRVFYANGTEENVQDRVGLLIMMIKGWQNEGEVLRLRGRVRATLKDMASQGRMVSRVPFGVRAIPLFEALCQGACGGDPKTCNQHHGEVSKKGAVWVVEPQELETLQIWYDWMAAGKSWGQLEREMERRGIRKPTRQLKRPNDPSRLGEEIGGASWDKASMRRIMTNPFYRGVFSWGIRESDRSGGNLKTHLHPESEWIQTEHALGPIIDPDLWWKALDQIERRTKTRDDSRAYPTLLWDGFVFCGRCGWKMYPVKRPQQPDRFDYKCHSRRSKSSRQRCTANHTIPERYLDYTLGIPLLGQGTRIPDIKVQFSAQTIKADSRAEIGRVATQLSDLDDQEERAAEERIRGRLKEDLLERQLARIEAERATLTARRAELERLPEDATTTDRPPAALKALMGELRDPQVPIEHRRALAVSLIDRFLINRPLVQVVLVEGSEL